MNGLQPHAPNWLEWLAPIIGRPGALGLELGCWQGQSAEWWLDHVLTGEGAQLHTVDTFEGGDEHRLAGMDCSQNERLAHERLARFGDKAKIWKSDTAEFLRNARSRYAMAYIDGPHDSMSVLRDSVLVFDLLEVGGVMVWDDYEWTAMRDPIDRPQPAIDSFLGCYARRVEVIGMGWQVAARKIA